MATYRIEEASLKAVADYIRTKSGVSGDLVFPSGYTAAIDEITGGGSAPFCAVSVKEDESKTVEKTVNIGVCVSVTAENYVA